MSAAFAHVTCNPFMARPKMAARIECLTLEWRYYVRQKPRSVLLYVPMPLKEWLAAYGHAYVRVNHE